MEREGGGQQGILQMSCKLFHASWALYSLDTEFLYFNIQPRYQGEGSERGRDARCIFNLCIG